MKVILAQKEVSTVKLCIIGLGKMGNTLLQGILEQGTFSAEDIVGCDLKVEKKEKNPEYKGIKTLKDNKKGAKNADIIIMAVKPNVIENVLTEIKSVIKNKLIISIAAGITRQQIKDKIDNKAEVVRVMPNTPALIKKGISALSFGKNISKEDKKIVKKIFKGVGQIVEIKEDLMDAVTGLSGSGPAFIYMIIEALADGGVYEGLDREVALKLAAGTVLGAAGMVLETEKHPGELKDMVTSPGGTTITGVKSLESDGLRAALIRAVEKASEKSRELGK